MVLKIKSVVPPVVTVSVPAPFERRVAAAAASPTETVSPARTTSPVPFGVIFISTLLSVPEAYKVGPAPAAALAIVNSLTALPVSVNFKSSNVPSPMWFPLTSNIPPS